MNNDPWENRGGKLNKSILPDWVERDVIELLESELQKVGSWISKGCRNSITFGLANDTYFWLKCVAVNDTAFVCPVPIGLILRLDYLFRFLELKKGAVDNHIPDGDFYGDYPDFIKEIRKDFQPPEPIATLASRNLSPDNFWKRLEEVDFEARQKGLYFRTYFIIDCIRYAVLFIAFHEAAHALRQHKLIISTAQDSKEAERGAELDADVMAMRWLTEYIFTDPLNVKSLFPPQLLRDLMFNMTYSVSALLGLFDIYRLAICNFVKDTYHQPTARLAVTVKGMKMALERHIFDEPNLKGIIESSADGANEYMARIISLWIKSGNVSETRRPTSIYFAPDPFAEVSQFAEASQDEIKKIPFSSLMLDPERPTFVNLQRKAWARHGEFEKLRQSFFLTQLITEYEIPISVLETYSASDIFDQLAVYFSENLDELNELIIKNQKQPSKISPEFMRFLLRELRGCILIGGLVNKYNLRIPVFATQSSKDIEDQIAIYFSENLNTLNDLAEIVKESAEVFYEVQSLLIEFQYRFALIELITKYNLSISSSVTNSSSIIIGELMSLFSKDPKELRQLFDDARINQSLNKTSLKIISDLRTQLIKEGIFN